MKQEPNHKQKDSDANRYVEELMYSLEDVQPAQPRPYLYGRVLARMDKLSQQDQLPSFLLLLNSKFNFGVLVVMVMLNVSAFWYYIDNQGIAFGPNATAEKIIEDYQLDYRSTYAYLEE